MSPTITASAPGKLMIVGEYAVLDGASAVSTAVQARARVTLAAISGTSSRLRVANADGEWPFRWSGGAGPHWESGSPGLLGQPLEAVIAVLQESGRLPPGAVLPTCTVTIETSEFHASAADGTRGKLGLGSSAAVIVALTAAMLRLSGENAGPGDLLTSLCHRAHRHLQGGQGSGADVVTSINGGLIGIETARGSEIPRAIPLVWPRQLQMTAVWSGRSSSTPIMLSKLASYRQAQSAGYAANMERLAAVSARIVRAWRADDLRQVLSGITAYDSALRNLDAESGIGIYTPQHERLRRIAGDCGAVYKTSGAGGGDFGIALADSRLVIGRVREAFAAEGYGLLDAELGGPGVIVQQRAQA